MDVSKKTTIIALAALLVTIVGVSSSVISSSPVEPTGPVDSGIFVRCDGKTGPVGDIKISSCPNASADGYCKIDPYVDVEYDISFTAGKYTLCTKISFYYLELHLYRILEQTSWISTILIQPKHIYSQFITYPFRTSIHQGRVSY